MDNNNLRIAIQKSGRLSKDSFSLLKNCGLKINISNKDRALFCKVDNMPIDILLVRDDDIPSFVSQNICDIGIVGKNVYQEDLYNPYKDIDITVAKELGFSKCRLSIATLKSNKINDLNSINDLKIATSYPNILKEFLKKEKIKAEIIKMKGSVELSPSLNISNAICDLVSSGATLEANSLEESTTILNSEAILITTNKEISKEKQDIINKLLPRIEGVIQASDSKYIMLNADKKNLPAITSILKGTGSPTIIPLEDSNKVAVHAVCSEAVFWETIETLKKNGASSILVTPIEKMML